MLEQRGGRSGDAVGWSGHEVPEIEAGAPS
jgi:hypothetical protein